MRCETRFEIPAAVSGDRLTGAGLAALVSGLFPGAGPSAIAAALGLKVVEERWFPVTAGEFIARKMLIVVNLEAPVERETIVAHELGHYFLRAAALPEREDEEKLCDAFAKELLNEVEKFNRLTRTAAN
jgi:hypothetical protein